MINTDKEALEIIELFNNNATHDEGRSLYELTIKLMKNYSFVENQTYPRPTHPLPEKRKGAYHTLTAILLSLRTTLENEQLATERFFENYKSLDQVAKGNVEEIAEIIKCAGMPMKKAKNIVDVTKYIVNNYNSDINNINTGNLEKTREILMELPGVGQKTADCMLELGFNLPTMVIDTNVFRVINRYYGFENLNINKNSDIIIIKEYLEKNIDKDGKYICKANPKCQECIISDKCLSKKICK